MDKSISLWVDYKEKPIIRMGG